MHDWNDLRYFLELARTGRLVAAARRLRVDHTTVARRIAALEQALAAHLFDKSPSGYVLTDAGHRLLPLAETIEAQSVQAFEQLSGEDAQRSGTVRLATPEAFGSYFLSPRLAPLLTRFPDIDLELVAESRAFSLSKREADILVTLSPPDSGRLVTQKLAAYSLRLYASPAYLQAAPPLRTPDDLGQHRIVTYVEDLVHLPHLRALAALTRQGHAQFRSTSIAAQTAAVAAGYGLGLLHDFAVAGRTDLLPVLPELFTVTREYWLVIPEDLRDIARIATVSQFVSQLCRRETRLLHV